MNIVFVRFLLFELLAMAWAKVCFQKLHLLLMHWPDWVCILVLIRVINSTVLIVLIIIWTGIFKLLLSFIVISRPCAADVMQSLPPTVETPNTEQLEQFGSIEFCKVEATVNYWLWYYANRHSKSANIEIFDWSIQSYRIISSSFIVTHLLYLLSVISIEVLLRSFQMQFTLIIVVHC